MAGVMVGDVVEAPISFTDFSGGKVRPVLILADVGMTDWILCPLTSGQQRRSDDIQITRGDMQSGSLPRDSWARASRLYTLNERVFRRTLGKVSNAKQAEVVAAVRSLF